MMKLQADVPHGTLDYPFQVHETNLTDGLFLYPHVHPEFELTLITEGEGKFYIDGIEYPVKKGDCLFIAPNKIHLADSNNILGKASFISIVFHPQCFCSEKNSLIYTKYVMPFVLEKLGSVPLMNGKEAWHAEIQKLIMEIRELYFGHKSELLCQSSMLKIWALIFDHSEEIEVSERNRSSNVLKDTIEYIQENYTEYMTVAEMAERVGLSPSHFSRVFNHYMHTSPIDFLIKERLQHSVDFLLQEDTSISEIAFKCGFNDFSYFSKCFRQRYGCSPREYRMVNMVVFNANRNYR